MSPRFCQGLEWSGHRRLQRQRISDSNQRRELAGFLQHRRDAHGPDLYHGDPLS